MQPRPLCISFPRLWCTSSGPGLPSIPGICSASVSSGIPSIPGICSASVSSGICSAFSRICYAAADKSDSGGPDPSCTCCHQSCCVSTSTNFRAFRILVDFSGSDRLITETESRLIRGCTVIIFISLYRRKQTNHLLHFIICLFCPWWIFVWLCVCICSG